jgi:hypothetical protein
MPYPRKFITSTFRILVITLVIVHISCDKNVTGNESTFRGITETDEAGNFTGNIDGSDWHSYGILELKPAYPNPATSISTLTFTLTDSADMNITCNASPDVVTGIILDKIMPIGTHTIAFDSENLTKNRLYRFIFRATTLDGKEYVSFGDVEFAK